MGQLCFAPTLPIYAWEWSMLRSRLLVASYSAALGAPYPYAVEIPLPEAPPSVLRRYSISTDAQALRCLRPIERQVQRGHGQT